MRGAMGVRGSGTKRVTPLTRVPVRSGASSSDYEVRIGCGALGALPSALADVLTARRWVVISDETVAGIYGGEVVDHMRAAGMDATLLTFRAGERYKTRETWAHLTDSLVEAGYGRDSAVVALGGGVTGDMAGFVAATFLRGVPVVQVPTSLVAMIDAAVGGKTGVDTPAGKNLVGAFHPPRLVLVDPEATLTLPRVERAQGLVEAVKHGAILDQAYLSGLETELPALLEGDPRATEWAVLQSVRLKADVVTRDEREGGVREILNFGHTIGHALEAASAFELAHGSAVGMGLVLEARLGEGLGLTESGVSERLAGVVERLGLESGPPAGTERANVAAYLGADKKRRDGRVRCVFLRRLGEVNADDGWTRPVEVEEVMRVIEESGRTN